MTEQDELKYGLLIAFEGIDQSGKQTQTEALAKALEERGISTVLLSFHDYDTITGEKIKAMLYGEIPFDPVIFQCVATINKYEKHHRIIEALMSNKVVICDRYLDSAMVYGMADGIDPAWLESIHAAMVQPDAVFYPQITVDESFRRKSEGRDHYEGDMDKLELVKDIYDHAAKVIPTWITIDGMQDKDAIAFQVLEHVLAILGANQ